MAAIQMSERWTSETKDSQRVLISEHLLRALCVSCQLNCVWLWSAPPSVSAIKRAHLHCHCSSSGQPSHCVWCPLNCLALPASADSTSSRRATTCGSRAPPGRRLAISRALALASIIVELKRGLFQPFIIMILDQFIVSLSMGCVCFKLGRFEKPPSATATRPSRSIDSSRSWPSRACNTLTCCCAPPARAARQ